MNRRDEWIQKQFVNIKPTSRAEATRVYVIARYLEEGFDAGDKEGFNRAIEEVLDLFPVAMPTDGHWRVDVSQVKEIYQKIKSLKGD